MNIAAVNVNIPFLAVTVLVAVFVGVLLRVTLK